MVEKRSIAAVNVNSLYSGVSSASFAAVAQVFYGPTSRPKRLLIGVLCGSTSSAAWHRLFTKALGNGKLDCAACSSVRGAALMTLTACILPSVAVACVSYKWQLRRDWTRAFMQLFAFVDYCLLPYSHGRPVFLLLGGCQAVLGYCLASLQFEDSFASRG